LYAAADRFSRRNVLKIVDIDSTASTV
jgi:hypothetical protein